MNDSYSLRQNHLDAEYKKAWEEAPPEFLAAAEKAGLFAHVDKPGRAMDYDDNRAETSVDVSMSDGIDTIYDILIEKYGVEHEEAIRGTVDDMVNIANKQMEVSNSLAVWRLISYLTRSETKNVKALLYASMHAIPRMAAANGINSMRESSRRCGVSVEWIRRSRNEICEVLQIQIPEESKKSVDAQHKYSENGKRNHWRSQTTKKGNKTCKKIVKKPQKPTRSLNSVSTRDRTRRSALLPRESSSATT